MRSAFAREGPVGAHAQRNSEDVGDLTGFAGGSSDGQLLKIDNEPRNRTTHVRATYDGDPPLRSSKRTRGWSRRSARFPSFGPAEGTGRRGRRRGTRVGEPRSRPALRRAPESPRGRRRRRATPFRAVGRVPPPASHAGVTRVARSSRAARGRETKGPPRPPVGTRPDRSSQR